MDAFRDFPEDIKNEQYNPLRPYINTNEGKAALSIEGLSWLRAQFNHINSSLELLLDQIPFERNATIIRKLITSPLTTLVQKMDRDITAQRELTIRPWKLSDSLSTSLALAPLIFTPEAFITKSNALILQSSHWADKYMLAMDGCSDYQPGGPGCILLTGIIFCLAMCGCCGDKCQLQACCFCEDLCKC
jgi:hypothetical protein